MNNHVWQYGEFTPFSANPSILLAARSHLLRYIMMSFETLLQLIQPQLMYVEDIRSRAEFRIWHQPAPNGEFRRFD